VSLDVIYTDSRTHRLLAQFELLGDLGDYFFWTCVGRVDDNVEELGVQEIFGGVEFAEFEVITCFTKFDFFLCFYMGVSTAEGSADSNFIITSK